MFTLTELFDPFVIVVLVLLLTDALVGYAAGAKKREASNMLGKPAAPALNNQGLRAF